MSQVKQLGSQLSQKLEEMEAICAEHGYEVVPTLLLRHAAGPSKSMLLSNDDLNKVVLCIAELGNIGEVVKDEEPARWRSIAVWPDSVSLGNTDSQSIDTHSSREAAEAVCRGLEREGFGGEGKIFPLSTRVEPVPE